MSQAKSGDTVQIHYTGKLDDGAQFDSSSSRDPLQFTLGSGQVIPGFEKAVEGITVDGNHPLAGKALKFAIELVDIARSA